METTHWSYLSSDCDMFHEAQIYSGSQQILVPLFWWAFLRFPPIAQLHGAVHFQTPSSTLRSILCMAFSTVNFPFLHLYGKPLWALFCWYLVKMSRPSPAYLSGPLWQCPYYTECCHFSQALYNLQGSNSFLCFGCLGQGKNRMT